MRLRSRSVLASQSKMARKRPKHRVRKFFGLAALGAVGAWLLRRRRGAEHPDGTWRDVTSSNSSGGQASG